MGTEMALRGVLLMPPPHIHFPLFWLSKPFKVSFIGAGFECVFKCLRAEVLKIDAQDN